MAEISRREAIAREIAEAFETFRAEHISVIIPTDEPAMRADDISRLTIDDCAHVAETAVAEWEREFWPTDEMVEAAGRAIRSLMPAMRDEQEMLNRWDDVARAALGAVFSTGRENTESGDIGGRR